MSWVGAPRRSVMRRRHRRRRWFSLLMLLVVVVAGTYVYRRVNQRPAVSQLPAVVSKHIVRLEEAGGDPSESEIAARQNITNVVFIIKESRSFDHLFGRFPGAEGP